MQQQTNPTSGSNQGNNAQSPQPLMVLLDMLTAPWMARCIHVATDLGISDQLKSGPLSIEALALATGTQPQALYRLLRCLATRGIFKEVEPQQFAQTELSMALVSGGPVYALVKMYGSEWQWNTWGDLEYSIRTGKAAVDDVYHQSLWEYLSSHPADEKVYNAALTITSQVANKPIALSYDFSTFSSIVDIAGGQGTLLTTLLSSYPALTGTLFEQPQVIEDVRTRIPAALQDRISLIGGNFFQSIPVHADAYIMKQVLHDWNDELALKILQNCRQVMHPGSKLLVIDNVIQNGGGRETTFSKLIDLLMLVTHAGCERTPDEFSALFSAAGFTLSRIIPTGTPVQIIEGVLA